MNQGQVEPDGSAATFDPTAPPRSQPDHGAKSELSPPARVAEFLREVRSELRQVAWPTRAEVANSATVVFITLVILVVLIFLLNYTFSHSISWLYRPAS
ncbi:MAG TPA: preprotein translocase subunit SecE [Acidimicrobiales bacterium]